MNKNPNPDWHFAEDPWGIIPVGFSNGNETVVGFCCPGTKTPYGTRVVVGSGTTGCYMTFLWAYMQSLSLQDVLNLDSEKMLQRGREAEKLFDINDE